MPRPTGGVVVQVDRPGGPVGLIRLAHMLTYTSFVARGLHAHAVNPDRNNSASRDASMHGDLDMLMSTQLGQLDRFARTEASFLRCLGASAYQW